MYRLPRLVLDTNVVLDLWLFQDPQLDSLRALLRERTVAWLSNGQCRDEFVRVLAYPEVDRFLVRHTTNSSAARSRALARFDDLAIDVGQPSIPCPLPLCRDPDDQFLVELAVGAGADILVTKDRQLLAMANSLRRAGFATRITTPANLPSLSAPQCMIFRD